MICDHCKKPILLSFYSSEGKHYHEKCFREKENLYCLICKQPLSSTYIVDNWGNKAHTYHKIEYCHCCGCFCSSGADIESYKHKDGRVICKYCLSKAILTHEQVLQSANHVWKHLNGVGFKNIPTTTKIDLVDQVKMNSISSIDSASGLAIISRTNYAFGKQDIYANIYVLDFLPEVHFQAVLAHEMLHVWIAKHKLKLGDYEEALCNIGSTLIYNSNRHDRLAVFLNDQMKINQDPLYGKRYMELKSRLKKIGWARFIAEVKSRNNYR